MAGMQAYHVLAHKTEKTSYEDLFMKGAEFTDDAKMELTRFLEMENEIPTREIICNHYDKVIPDSFEKARKVAKECMQTDDCEEKKRLRIPVIPNMYFKTIVHENPLRIVVEARGENTDFRMLVFSVKGKYYLREEVIFQILEDGHVGIVSHTPWYKKFCELYGLWEPEIKESESFMRFTYPKCAYYDVVFDIAQDLLYSELLQKAAKEDVQTFLSDYLDLLIYMNYCIDLESKKRMEMEKDAGNETKLQPGGADPKKVLVDRKGPSQKKGVITIGDISIHVGKCSKTKRGKVMHRKYLCWGVRGHKRYYKNGKVVYIKPYKKGIDREKIPAESKSYYINSNLELGTH